MLGASKGVPVGDEAQSDQEQLQEVIKDLKVGGHVVHAYNVVAMMVEAGGIIAATTFLQSLTQHFGTRLAGTLDRAAVRRFLRRQQEEASGPVGIAGFDLRTEQGWRVSMTTDLPAEALVQLRDICEAAPPIAGVSTLLINYGRSGWEAWGVADGDYVRYRWEPEEMRWAPRQQG
ncbi:hypothetical protein AB0N26_22890 [Streptomyces cellulosae]